MVFPVSLLGPCLQKPQSSITRIRRKRKRIRLGEWVQQLWGYRMLRRTSHDTSRASSVVSTAHSAESSAFSAQQSPTFARQSSNFKPDPPVLYHVHSGIHHRHSRPPTASRPSQTQQHPVALSSQSADVSAQLTASRPSHSQRAAVAHSPVTRTNCQFHRISLPREEGGFNVLFIVLGCFLTSSSPFSKPRRLDLPIRDLS
jgi:hypothetical protein